MVWFDDLKIYTLTDLENFNVLEDGKIICPTGNYCEIKEFPENCYFFSDCAFGDDVIFNQNTTFRDRCSFGENCTFRSGKLGSCKFGNNCRFGKECKFDDSQYSYLDFGNGCDFKSHCVFGKEMKFGYNCEFDNCRFGELNNFKSDCIFKNDCRFGLLNSFGNCCEFDKNCEFNLNPEFGSNCSIINLGTMLNTDGRSPIITISGVGNYSKIVQFFNLDEGIYVIYNIDSICRIEEFEGMIKTNTVSEETGEPIEKEFLSITKMVKSLFERE